MEIEELYTLYKKSYKVTTDTRSQLNNSIFFALKGDNFNGNLYAKEALTKGANFAVIDEEQDELEDKLILVKDVLQTLQNLATYHRQCLDIPIIALTGSNGKTTTKELINAVLKQKFNCKSTAGNLNNHIGVPLTILSMEPETEIGVVEMGANHKKEIAELCKIALPDFGYITNFGKVHLEGFGSLKGVIEAKTEMYSYLRKENKMVFINTEDKIQVERSKGMNIISFCSKNSDYPVEFIEADPYVNVAFENMILQSKLIGKYNYLNIATAIAAGKYFGVSNTQIKEAIEEYVPSNNRSQIITKGSNEIILDAYNANPESMKVAIENLSQISAENKVAILGDMYEVGKSSQEEHQKIVEMLRSSDIQTTYLIGDQFSEILVNDENIIQYKNIKDFRVNMERSKLRKAMILIKASRGMALERVLEFI